MRLKHMTVVVIIAALICLASASSKTSDSDTCSTNKDCDHPFKTCVNQY